MKALNERLSSTRARLAVGGFGLVLVLAAAWLLVVSPQRSKVGDLKQSVEAAQTELVTRQQALARPSADVKVRASDTYRLTKALPDGVGMAGVILDVNRVAKNALAHVHLDRSCLGRRGFRLQRPAPDPRAARPLQQRLGIPRGHPRAGSRSQEHARCPWTAVLGHGRRSRQGRRRGVPGRQGDVTLQSFTFSGAPPAADTGTTPSTTPSSSGTVAAGATP